jgi:hypothetical protein
MHADAICNIFVYVFSEVGSLRWETSDNLLLLNLLVGYSVTAAVSSSSSSSEIWILYDLLYATDTPPINIGITVVNNTNNYPKVAALRWADPPSPSKEPCWLSTRFTISELSLNRSRPESLILQGRRTIIPSWVLLLPLLDLERSLPQHVELPSFSLKLETGSDAKPAAPCTSGFGPPLDFVTKNETFLV